MATKTFEELKQLAIQIRDEKTNKQNTATRIGTQMLEHLDKLEQDYYDKTATDEKFTEIENKTPSNFIKTSVDVKDSIINIGWLKPDNTVVDDSRWKYGYVEVPAGALSFYLSNYSLQVESAPAIVFLNTDNTVISYLSYRNKTCIFGNIPEDCTKIGFSVYSSKVETFRCEFRSNYTTDKNIDTELANLYNEINPKLVFPYILETGLDVKEQITETGWVQNSGRLNQTVHGKMVKYLFRQAAKI